MSLTHIRMDQEGRGSTRNGPEEDAITIHVLLKQLQAPELRRKRERLDIENAERGSTFIFDLTNPPIGRFIGEFNTVRLFMSKATISEIARENDIKWRGCLIQRKWGFSDSVIPNLLMSSLPYFDRPAAESSLFIDQLLLATISYVVVTHGDGVASCGDARGGLRRWQIDRAHALLEDRLSSRLTLHELAAECGLSSRHFARAFQTQFGMSPHIYHMRLRIAALKHRLQASPDKPLSEAAFEFGFADQSHMSRVFSRFEGIPPAAWLRQTKPLAFYTANPARADRSLYRP